MRTTSNARGACSAGPWRATAPACKAASAGAATTHDRLPLAGRAPDPHAALPARRDAPRLLPRQPGLYLLSGLGSRGLTSAALAGELVAAQISGAPWPIEADLVDAVDPARLLLR